jgi:hypothetical protein
MTGPIRYPSPKAEQANDEIEVTPAMLDAGCEALPSIFPDQIAAIVRNASEGAPRFCQ